MNSSSTESADEDSTASDRSSDNPYTIPNGQSPPQVSPNDPGEDCALSVNQQRRNIACFATFWAIFYLAAPVSYIGLTHANLLKGLGNSDTVSNLPHAVYMWLALIPVLTSWLLPQARYVKPLAIAAAGAMVLMTAVVGLTIWADVSRGMETCVVIGHGAVFGGANGILVSSVWDLLRRGVSTSRRGIAMGFASGLGPVFACVGALLQDALFDGQLLGGFQFGLTFPQNYMAMFLTVAPLLAGIGICLALFHVPPVDERQTAAGRTTTAEIVAGMKQFVQNRSVLIAVVIYVIVYSGGNAIFANVSLHARDILPNQSDTLGIQNFLRFGCKAVAGVLLGWLLAKASPRATLLATTMILLIGMLWALTSSGVLFMATFGLLGAGELFGAYYPNYVTTASSKAFVRINIAYLSAISMVIGFSSVAFGKISDHFGRMASFMVAAGMLATAMVLVLLLLPANPTPKDEVIPGD